MCRGSRGDAKTSLTSLQGLQGYTGDTNIITYPGRAGVFTVPSQSQMRAWWGLQQGRNLSVIGYIADGTGAYVHLARLWCC
jgi:hypothetical protein